MPEHSKLAIFLTGATGYIGGTCLSHLLDHPGASGFTINALVRTPEKAEKLKGLGINPVLGSLEDSDLLQHQASEADVILSMADADGLASVKAMLSGMKKRFEKTGKPPIFIQTSGTGVLIDNAAGMYAYDTIWDDSDTDQMASLAPTQPHRNVDLTILEADSAGYVKAYLILPPTIYGIAKGRLAKSGIANAYSLQIPMLIRASLDRKQGGMVGKGKNIWPNVYIEELGDLYITLFDAALNRPATGHGKDGYYFAENGEHTLYEIGKGIAEVLVDLGVSQSPEPTTFTKEEVIKYFGNEFMGTNSRCRATHSRSIGWKPTKTTKDMLASIRPEVEETIKHGKTAEK